ncbi:MAG: PaaI family thioesterase [Caulobacter sp.]|nr:PaaI family thioesterase [Caulobacter sp.]
MTDERVPAPPEGFKASARGPYTTHNGPFFHRLDDDGLEHGFFALGRHCNSLGIVHGGMLSTFMDGVLAGAVGRDAGTASVTVHLSLDFLSMARAGDWVTGDARVTRTTKDLVFVEGRIRVGNRDVMRASGIFKPIRRRADQAAPNRDVRPD